MPHVTIKMYPGQEENVKQELAKDIEKMLVKHLGVKESAVSVSILEVESQNWKQEVYDVEINDTNKKLYIAPGYKM